MADFQSTTARLDKNGRPIGGRAGRSVVDRFNAYVTERGDGCWVWKGPITLYRYGRMSVGTPPNKKEYQAHRLSWELHRGPIPDGLYVCHHCDNPPCVNPDHLFLGTQSDNMCDASRKGRVRGGVKVGSANGNSKLTEFQAREIRDSWPAVSHRKLAEKHGVSRSLVRFITKGANWKHV
jgi:hypothetical protein